MIVCEHCEREWSACRCTRREREDDRRRTPRHVSDTEDQYPSWDDVIRAMEDDE